MEYLKASMLLGFWSSSILFLIYMILYKIEKRDFLKIWAASLALRGIVYILDYNILIINNTDLNLFSVIRQVILMVAIYLNVKGIYLFMSKPFKKIKVIVLSLIIICNTLTLIQHNSYLINMLIIFVGIFGLNLHIVFYEFKDFKSNALYTPMKIFMTAMSILNIVLILSTYLHISVSTISIMYSCNQLLAYVTALLIKFEESKLELIKTQKKLLESEKRLRNILDNQRDMIFELDICGKFCFVSDSINEILQYTSKEVIGKNIREIISFDIDSILTKVIAFGEKEIKCKSKEGRIVYINMNWKMVWDDEDNFTGIIGIIRDITKNKKLEEFIEADKIKTEFLTNISHDIKTPLNIINGTVQLMDLQASLRNETSMIKHTQIIRKNVFRLLKLTNNFIDISRIESGYVEIYRENCNVVQVVEDTVLSAADYISSKNIILEFDTEEEEIITSIDIDKMERIILNLLSNAVKFTPSKGKIFVYMKKRENCVFISIRDTGRGIPKDKLENVFARYSQIENFDESFHKGSGIGLSIVKSFVELHGGKVWVESSIGIGSEFIIKLPIVVVKNGESVLKESIGEKINIELSDI